MARGPKPDLLQRAIHAWTIETLSRTPETDFAAHGSERDIVRALDANEEQHILEIGTHLHGQHRFRGPGELVQFLSDQLASALRAAGPGAVDTASLARHLAQRVANPLQTFMFTAPLTVRGAASWHGPIGGPSQLAFRSIDRDGDIATAISGHVEAPTEPAAITAVEEIVEATLGLCLALDLCIMLAPLPGSGSTLFLDISPHNSGVPTRLSGLVSTAVSGALFRIPPHIAAVAGANTESAERHRENAAECLARVLASTEQRAQELRRAGVLFLRASVSVDPGLALTYAFMCLEGILLERSTVDNVQSRLVEAVAYRIGTSAQDRARLRREIKELYEIRSRYVHTGDAGPLAWTRPRERCLDVVGRVLFREIDEALG